MWTCANLLISNISPQMVYNVLEPADLDESLSHHHLPVMPMEGLQDDHHDMSTVV
jgi:hypothetical protein